MKKWEKPMLDCLNLELTSNVCPRAIIGVITVTCSNCNFTQTASVDEVAQKCPTCGGDVTIVGCNSVPSVSGS